MVIGETAKLLAVIAAAYPEKFIVDDTKVKLWFELLKDVPYQVAQIAVQKHILESPYIPTISDIRKEAVDISTPPEIKKDAAEAWGEVTKAIRYYGTYRESEALASMSPQTQKIVQFIGWQNICQTEELDVLRGQFRKMYETTENREKQDRLMPAELKKMIAGITEKSKALTEGGINSE